MSVRGDASEGFDDDDVKGDIRAADLFWTESRFASTSCSSVVGKDVYQPSG